MDIKSGILSMTNIFDTATLDNLPQSKEAKTKAVSAAFASIFLNEMLQTARKANLGTDNFFDSDETKMSQKLYYEQLSSTIAGSDSFGITKLIQNEINSQDKT